jgi:L-rhamnose-H+ transport protein
MNIAAGILLSVTAGIFLGSFALPSKSIRKWEWENYWGIFTLFGAIILPLLLAMVTIPGFQGIYSDVPRKIIITVMAFGAGWGLSNIGFGLGLKMVGLSVGTAIMLGLSNTLGALMPLIIYQPEQMETQAGKVIIAGITVMLVGIVLFALASIRRDKKKQQASEGPASNAYVRGVIILVIAGICSAMFNLALVAGKPIETLAAANGAIGIHVSNATWVLSLSAGGTVTIIYCIYLGIRRKTLSLFIRAEKPVFPAKNYILAIIMGIMWFGGVTLYGMGVTKLGILGASIGWPLIQSVAIISGSVSGILTGEWKGADKGAVIYMISGMILLFLGMGVISWAGTL